MKTLDRIKAKVNAQRYEMSDFYAVCPFTIEQLCKPNRKNEIKEWRQIGMVWGRLSGLTTTKTGKMFSKDHSTVIHSTKFILDCIEGYGYESILEKIKEVTTGVKTVRQHEDMNVNEAVCAVLINNRLMEMI
jgi:chromosomal replication initiation ATPase DnaA